MPVLVFYKFGEDSVNNKQTLLRIRSNRHLSAFKGK